MDIKTKIEKLSEIQQQEIFKILLKNNERYTTNANGIFVNISLLKKTTITEMNNYINFCLTSDSYLLNTSYEKTDTSTGIVC